MALFLARRRCFLRSAGSSISSRLGAGFFRFLPLSPPLALGSALGSLLIPAGWVPDPEDLQEHDMRSDYVALHSFAPDDILLLRHFSARETREVEPKDLKLPEKVACCPQPTCADSWCIST